MHICSMEIVIITPLVIFNAYFPPPIIPHVITIVITFCSQTIRLKSGMVSYVGAIKIDEWTARTIVSYLVLLCMLCLFLIALYRINFIMYGYLVLKLTLIKLALM